MPSSSATVERGLKVKKIGAVAQHVLIKPLIVEARASPLPCPWPLVLPHPQRLHALARYWVGALLFEREDQAFS